MFLLIIASVRLSLTVHWSRDSLERVVCHAGWKGCLVADGRVQVPDGIPAPSPVSRAPSQINDGTRLAPYNHMDEW
jgi:hypothetical protein